MLAVADRTGSFIITGNGDVLEPEYGIVAIGSGGAYAQAAAPLLAQVATFYAQVVDAVPHLRDAILRALSDGLPPLSAYPASQRTTIETQQKNMKLRKPGPASPESSRA
jgi:hypothetical protein